jgi:hypothetical protein
MALSANVKYFRSASALEDLEVAGQVAIRILIVIRKVGLTRKLSQLLAQILFPLGSFQRSAED